MTKPPLPQILPELEAPVTQEKKGFRENWPEWLKKMPRRKFPPPNDDFQLITPDSLEELLSEVDPLAATEIRADIKHMDYELLRLFRKLDYEAAYQQNRYYGYQMTYIILAFLATLFGSLLALSLNGKPGLVPLFAFAETFIALATTYLATVSGREAPMPLWLENRRRAETLRREYFRYLMNLPPYDEVSGYQREMLLSRRSADINQGIFSEDIGG
jgi:hypothetical protein